MANLRITQSGATPTVHLDGLDITRSLRGMMLRMDVDSLPSVELDVLVLELDTETEDASVEVPEETHAALVALGWTPPKEA